MFLDEPPEETTTTTSTTITLRNLENFANYSIQVLAYTKSGDGPLSEAVFCRTLDDGKVTTVLVRWRSRAFIIDNGPLFY